MLQVARPILTLLTLSALTGSDVFSAEIQPDIVYGHKDGLAMTMDRFPPSGEPNGRAILFMVSGGWVSKWAPPGQYAPFFTPFTKAGYTMFAVRHGSSPRYSIPEAVSDVRRAVRFVRANAQKLKVNGKHIGVLGMSAGGHLALMLGTTGDDGTKNGKDPLARISCRVQAVVALVPPTDLRVAVWEAPESLPAYKNFPALNLSLKKAREHSPLVHVTPDDAPSLVIMGGKDELVPPRHGKWIDEAFAKNKVAHRLVIYPSKGHDLGGLANLHGVMKQSRGWFDEHLVGNEK